VQTVKTDWINADISLKMKALLNIAGKVQQGGKHVTEEDVAAARTQGATDREIHDTVLIAAVFCMANRYVDGLGPGLHSNWKFIAAMRPRSWPTGIRR
jgi:alkylhydroperoxidase/carboxymuconolactone decarboxylase family protein YurZ